MIHVPSSGCSDSAAMAENAVLSAILTGLSGKAVEYFRAEAGRDSAFQLTSMSQRSYSTIYFFELTGKRKVAEPRPAIAVKVYRDRSSGMESAQLQYRSLLLLWPSFRDGASFGLPKPLDYFSDMPALVMERVSGSSLQELFSKMKVMPSHQRMLASACRHTGHWLTRLHVATSLVPGKLNAEEKLVHATSNLMKLESMGFSHDLCHRSADFLKRQADRLAFSETKMALVHGDFTVDNVMVDGDRIVGLDLTRLDHNAIEHDLATFLNSLRLLRLTMPLPRALLNRCSE